MSCPFLKGDWYCTVVDKDVDYSTTSRFCNTSCDYEDCPNYKQATQ